MGSPWNPRKRRWKYSSCWYLTCPGVGLAFIVPVLLFINQPDQGGGFAPLGQHTVLFSNQSRSKHLPQAICIGCTKCGASMLLHFLSMNPWMNIPQNTNRFFDLNVNYEKGLEAYLEGMPEGNAQQITVEKAQHYFNLGTTVAPRIHAMNSSIKLILILRDPIQRLISEYEQYVGLPNVPVVRMENFQNLENLAFSSVDGSLNRMYAPVVNSAYAVHMEAWLALFPRHQILVLDGEQFIRDPLSVLYQCEEFLGIPHLVREAMFKWNGTKGFYCVADRKCIPSKGRSRARYPAQFIQKLKVLYRPYTLKLFSMLGQTFDWPSMRQTASWEHL